MRALVAAVVVVCILLGVARAVVCAQRVKIGAPAFTPAICKDGRCGADVTIVVTVEPDAANRVLQVEADSGAAYRASAFDLRGVDGPKTSRVAWRALPVGDYEVAATVLRADGSHETARAVVHVVGF